MSGNKLNNHTRGQLSKLRGQRFESLIEAACDYYRRRGEADIIKTPEPMKPIKSLGAGRFVAVYTSTAQADFKGTLKGGRSILFEAKYTATGKMQQDRVTPEQAEQLEQEYKLGAVVFVLCAFEGNGVYNIPWSVWRDMSQCYGRKYITQRDVAECRVSEYGGIIRFLDGVTRELVKECNEQYLKGYESGKASATIHADWKWFEDWTHGTPDCPYD